MALPDKVRIVEVGPRDGLQNQSTSLPPTIRAELVQKLNQAGLKQIEVGSFVAPGRIPQLADSHEVIALLGDISNKRYSALTPNLKGYEKALAAGVQEVAVFTAATDSFCEHNIHCTVAESLARFQPVLAAAGQDGIPVRGYVSCTLGCPYEGRVSPTQVADVAMQLIDLGCYEISLGDTIGTGTPITAQAMFAKVAEQIPKPQLAAHFHDTYGQALTNLYALLLEGLEVIDSAVAGLGGCPYAPGASGNVATEDVLYLLEGLGIDHDGELGAVAEVGRWICQALNIEVNSKVSRALAAKNRAN